MKRPWRDFIKISGRRSGWVTKRRSLERREMILKCRESPARSQGSLACPLLSFTQEYDKFLLLMQTGKRAVLARGIWAVHPKIAESRELPISGRTRRCIPTPWVNRLAHRSSNTSLERSNSTHREFIRSEIGIPDSAHSHRIGDECQSC